MPNIEVRGYSERGMINAMMYEMNYAPDGIEMLRNFLKLCVFPNVNPDFENFQSARIRIEQSFSDFGDLDLLILLEGNPKQSVFLEAKVKTFQANSRSIFKEWDIFKQVVQGTLTKKEKGSNHGSNLFIQLYRKMRLIYKLQNPNLQLQPNIIGKWSLGENRVVRKAAEELAQYSSKTWFIALVPDSQKDIADFFKNKLQNFPTELPDWNIFNVGYLAWESLENYCRNFPNEWIQTLSNFDYNHEQIFKSGQIMAANNQHPPHQEELFVKGYQIIKYTGKICHLSCKGYSFAIRHFQNGKFVEIYRGSKDKEKYISLKNQIQVLEQAPRVSIENTEKNTDFWAHYFSSYTKGNQ